MFGLRFLAACALFCCQIVKLWVRFVQLVVCVPYKWKILMWVNPEMSQEWQMFP